VNIWEREVEGRRGREGEGRGGRGGANPEKRK